MLISNYITPVMFTDSTGYSLNYSVNRDSIVFDFVFVRKNTNNTTNLLLSSSLNTNTEIDNEDYIKDFWKFSPERAKWSLLISGALVGGITGYCWVTTASLTAFLTGVAISAAVVIGVAIVIYVVITIVANISKEDNFYE